MFICVTSFVPTYIVVVVDISVIRIDNFLNKNLNKINCYKYINVGVFRNSFCEIHVQNK